MILWNIHFLLLATLALPLPGADCAPLHLAMARVYANVNAQMPRSYWDYDSVNISWGVLENYEVVRKIGTQSMPMRRSRSR